MDISKTTPTPGEGAEIPPFKCPHCRTENPVIEYGELVYASQRYDLDTEEWDCWEVADADGSSYVSATCQQCENNVVLALTKYDAKYPHNTIPSHFVHEVQIPLGLPMPRRSRVAREWALWDAKGLQDRIIHLSLALGHLLDERDARARVLAKQRKAEATK